MQLIGRKNPYHQCGKCLKKARYYHHEKINEMQVVFYTCEEHNKRGEKIEELTGDQQRFLFGW